MAETLTKRDREILRDEEDAKAPADIVGQTVGVHEHLPLSHFAGCPVDEDEELAGRLESYTDTAPGTGATVHVTRCQQCGAHAVKEV